MIKPKKSTFISMIFTIAIMVILEALTMHVVPVYLQNYEINNFIEAQADVEPSLF
jgi:hypothetical protein